MTGNHFERLLIAMAMPILCGATGIGCEGSRTGLLVGRDAAIFADAGGSAGPAATGAGGSAGPAATGAGGATSRGGATSAGGATSRGGATGAGGMIVAGSRTSAGGTAGGAGGASTAPVNRDAGVAVGGTSGTGRTTMASAPVISDSGYVKVSAGTVVMMGFIVSSTAGSGSSISLTYGTSDFCASGTVAANSTYNSWANAGFTVNQDPSGASGSSSPLVLSGVRFPSAT